MPKREFRCADANHRAVGECVGGDLCAIDPCAVAAAEITEHPAARLAANRGMGTAREAISEHDRRILSPAQHVFPRRVEHEGRSRAAGDPQFERGGRRCSRGGRQFLGRVAGHGRRARASGDGGGAGVAFVTNSTIKSHVWRWNCGPGLSVVISTENLPLASKRLPIVALPAADTGWAERWQGAFGGSPGQLRGLLVVGHGTADPLGARWAY